MPLANKLDFVGLDDVHYFYTGAEGPPLEALKNAALRYIDNRALGEAGRSEHESVLSSCRTLLGNMMGVSSQNIAILSNASEALHRVTEGIPWNRGANVVTCDIEFPSVTLPLVQLREQGIEVRVVSSHDWLVTAADIARSVDDKTQAIFVSHVSYMSGSRFDLEALASLAREVGAVLVIDATQALGVIPVEARLADFVISSTHKWLLGPHGCGVLYVRDPESSPSQPRHVGWRSVQHMFADDRFDRYDLWSDARRWELGYPSFPSLYLLEASLKYINRYQPREIESHVHELGGLLLDGAAGLGMTLMTPRDPAQRAGNIAIQASSPEKLAKDLAARKILAWGGDGRIRFSIHLFNDRDDVETALSALQELVRKE